MGPIDALLGGSVTPSYVLKEARSLYNSWKTKWLHLPPKSKYLVWCKPYFGGKCSTRTSNLFGVRACRDRVQSPTRGFPCALNIIFVVPLAWAHLRWISDRRMKNQSVNQATRFLSSGPMSQAYWAGVGFEIDHDFIAAI